MLGLLGLWLLYWSLLKDRAKGKRRCPKCWYDMSATEGLRCSECGNEAKREKKLFKTRRRLRWAFVAIGILIAGHVTHTVPRIQKAGWIGTIPTTALISVFPWQHKMRWNTTLAYQPGWGGAISSELQRRIKANETWHWQNHKLAWIHFEYTLNHQLEGAELAADTYSVFTTIGNDVNILHPKLFERLKSKDLGKVLTAGEMLAAHPTEDPTVLSKLEALFKHEDEEVRERAPFIIVNCSKNNPDYAIPKLIAAMHDPSSKVISSAINAVWHIEPAPYKLIPTIEEFVDHENEDVRLQAGWVLDYLNAAKNKPVRKIPASSK